MTTVAAARSVVRDGVRLAYIEAGVGDPPLLLIHGWCCNHSFWREQLSAFSGQHRIVAVDLRGHGESDKPQQDYTIGGFAEDVAWLCERTGLKRPVVVGHSMGGMIAFELVRRYRALARAAVFVDSPLMPFSEDMQATLAEVQAGLASPQYKEVAAQLIEAMLFLADSSRDLVDWTVRSMTSAPQQVMASAFASIVSTAAELPAGELPVPGLFVSASDGPYPISAIKARYPNAQVAQVACAGHFLQLEAPDQFNAMLRRFLEVST